MFERTSRLAAHGLVLANEAEKVRTVGLREMFRTIKRRWRIVLACIIALLLPAALYLFVAPRIYTSSTTILVEPRRQSVVTNDAPAPVFGTEAAIIESQVQILRSPPVARRVVAKLNLVEDPEFGLQRKRRLDMAREAVAGVIAGTLGTWAVPGFLVPAADPATAKLTDEQKIIAVAAKLERQLSVSRVGTTHVILVSFSSETPDSATRIVNAFAEAYLTDAYETRFEATRRAATWLEDRLEQLRIKTLESERSVEAYRAQNNLISAGGRLVAEQQVTEINNQLVNARARVAETKARLETAQEIINSGADPGAITEALTNEPINRLKIQYSDISRRIADLQTRYGARHPAVRNAQAELADTQSLIQDELRRVAQSLKNEYEVSLSREQSLSRSMAEVEARAAANNAAQVKLRELERDATTDRTLYQTFLSRFKETNVQEGVPASEARVLAPGERPRDPSEPKAMLVMSLAFILGLFGGVTLVFVAEHMDETLRTRDDVESKLSLHMLTRIPLVRTTGSKLRHLAVDKPLSAYAEAIRTLRMSLAMGHGGGKPPKVVAVASALPGEGKTTTAGNLAEYIASTGLKTLLIDADLRRPALSRSYHPDAKVGFGQVLLGEAAIGDATIIDNRTSLHVVPHLADSRIVDTAELLGSRRMAELLADMRINYDLVIIDVSPLIPVIDARLLLEHVDSIMIVVEWNKTGGRVVQEALRLIQPWHQKILGVVLNKVDGRKSHHDDDYGSAAYAKKYPHYYGHHV